MGYPRCGKLPSVLVGGIASANHREVARRTSFLLQMTSQSDGYFRYHCIASEREFFAPRNGPSLPVFQAAAGAKLSQVNVSPVAIFHLVSGLNLWL